MKLIDKDNRSRGMTLVEVLVVIVLIGLIAAVVSKGVIGKGAAAKAELNVSKMNGLVESIKQYRFKYNQYPAALADLSKANPELSKQGKLFTPLATEGELKDVWGFPYIYKTGNNGRTFTLETYGEDGIAGGEGVDQDISLGP